VLGNPILPVWRGEIQCRALGLKVEVFNDEGALGGGQRASSCARARFHPPVGFWATPAGRNTARYFERFPGVWTHGGLVRADAHGGMIIYGRSDAVLNPGGVRIGTAEIYRQGRATGGGGRVAVIGQTWPRGKCDVRVVLFVKLASGLALDEP